MDSNCTRTFVGDLYGERRSLRQSKPRWAQLQWACAAAWLLIVGQAFAAESAPGRWAPQTPIVKVSLRGVSTPDANTVWASGAKGTILRSVDGGQSFEQLSSPAGAEVDYRDIHAFDQTRASLLTAGQPAKLFHTSDGGKSWSLAFESKHPKAFFNAMDFWDAKKGIAFSDAIEGKLLIVRTEDGGRSWKESPRAERPELAASEHGFAASGTCLTTGRDGRVWIGLGGTTSESSVSRVLHSADYGRTWSSASSDIPGAEAAGVFSLAVIRKSSLVAVGGDYLKPDAVKGLMSISRDAGKSWQAVSGNGLRGYRSCVALLLQKDAHALIAVGPNGADYSSDDGHHWKPIPGQGYHACTFAPQGLAGWAVGAEGRMAKWEPAAK